MWQDNQLQWEEKFKSLKAEQNNSEEFTDRLKHSINPTKIWTKILENEPHISRISQWFQAQTVEDLTWFSLCMLWHLLILTLKQLL